MRGRFLLLPAGLALAAFTGILVYFQFYAFYGELEQEPLTIMGAEYPVTGWQGIDASSSPLKKRVCLTLTPDTAKAIADDQFELVNGEPLVAPDWFECFDAKQIARDLEARRAQLYMIGSSDFQGVEEMLALYPDGRGFMWRQLKPEFRQ